MIQSPTFSTLIFLNPSNFWALLFLVVPIIVHLFNLRRVKRIQFSNISFLRKVQNESTSKRKPIELLILCSRLMALICLILVFTKPILSDRRNEVNNDIKEVMVYLDNSLSLSVKSGANDLFSKGQNVFKSIIRSYPAGTEFNLLDNSFSGSSSYMSLLELEDLVIETNVIGVTRDFEEILRRFGQRQINGDLYLVSDFQEVPSRDELEYVEGSRVNIIPLISDEFANVYVDSAYLKDSYLSGSFDNFLTLKLNRTSSTIAEAKLKIFINDQLSGTANVLFDNSQSVSYDYVLPDDVRQSTILTIEIEANDVSFDNKFFLSIQSLEKVSVVEVQDSNSTNFFEALFVDNNVFNYSKLNKNRLNNEILRSADLLILNELNNLSNQLVANINDFRQKGGVLLLVPSLNTNSDEWSKIGIGAIRGSERRLTLETPDYENPFFEGIFEEQEANLSMPEATTSWELNQPSEPILEFINGKSFLSRITDLGNTIFFTSPLANEYSSFGNHALFVPIIYKLALGAQTSAQDLYDYTDSEIFSFSMEENLEGVVKLENGETSLVPDQRVQNGELVLTIPKEELSAGFYQLKLDDTVLTTLAFNWPKSESNLKNIDMGSLEAITELENVEIIDGSSIEEVSSVISNSVNGKPLWKLFIIAALFFLFAEIILIRYL